MEGRRVTIFTETGGKAQGADSGAASYGSMWSISSNCPYFPGRIRGNHDWGGWRLEVALEV